MTNNPNHPKKGSSIKVEPIRQKAAIERIKAALLRGGKYRDHCIFTLGINTAFRANELLSITVGQAANLKAGGTLELKQSKNKKYRMVTINQTAAEAIQLYLENDWHILWCIKNNPDTPLFYSQKGGGLTVGTLTALLKKWCEEAGCKGNYGSHTMRKTWGYHQHKRGVSIPVLMEAYGHATQKQTLDYLCIQAEEIKEIYDMEL